MDYPRVLRLFLAYKPACAHACLGDFREVARFCFDRGERLSETGIYSILSSLELTQFFFKRDPTNISNLFIEAINLGQLSIVEFLFPEVQTQEWLVFKWLQLTVIFQLFNSF
jgi:hypothetical protein